jgi:hypothetical protein
LTAKEFRNNNITTEDFTVDAGDIIIDGVRNLPLTSGDTVSAAALNENVLISGEYIYYKAVGSTGPATPSMNDIRVKYTYIPGVIEGVLLGKAEGNSIVKFTNEDASLYRFFQGSTLEAAVATLNAEHKASTWLFRIIGAIGMCLGFALLTGPFSTILMVVPFLGHASKFILGIATFLVGFLYSVVVIAISAIFHNMIALIIAIAIIILLILIGISKRKKKTARA